MLVLNTDKAVDQFKHARVKMGGEISVAAGPVGDGRQLDVSRSASWSYTKSKGLYVGVQIDGNIIIERGDENERFYGRRYKASELLSGTVPRPAAAEGLYQTLAAAQGLETRRDAIPSGPTPSEETHKVDQDIVSGEAPPEYEQAVGKEGMSVAPEKTSTY